MPERKVVMLETIYQVATKFHLLEVGIGILCAVWVFKALFYDIRGLRKTKKPEDFIKE